MEPKIIILSSKYGKHQQFETAILDEQNRVTGGEHGQKPNDDAFCPCCGSFEIDVEAHQERNNCYQYVPSCYMNSVISGKPDLPTGVIYEIIEEGA